MLAKRMRVNLFAIEFLTMTYDGLNVVGISEMYDQNITSFPPPPQINLLLSKSQLSI
jgi:hypothetical protein